MDLAKVKGGTTFGKDERSLLHEVCDSIGENDWTEERFDQAGDSENVFDTSSSVNWLVAEKAVDERVLPTIALLLDRGDRVDAKDKRGKTPLDLARRGRKELRAQDWKRVEAALSGHAPTPSSTPKAAKKSSTAAAPLDEYFHDSALALGVLGALMRDGVVKKASLAKVLDELDADDASAREAVAIQALHRSRVTPKQLAEIEALSFEVDEPIYTWLAEKIDVDLGGESEALVVGSLEGLQHLTGLKTLDLGYGYGAAPKLDPLFEHLDTFARLERFGAGAATLSKAFMRKLAERGIEVAEPNAKKTAAKKTVVQNPSTQAQAKKTAAKKTVVQNPSTQAQAKTTAAKKTVVQNPSTQAQAKKTATKAPAKKAAAKEGARRFELVEGGSSKFWEVELGARKVVTRYGRIGSAGQTTEKAFATKEEAEREHDRLVAEKTKKGYRET
jgi:predicted DNA-binding WGR domain protein